MSHIPNFPEFDPDNDKTNVGKRWKKYTARLENFFLAMNIKDDARKRALLLHYIGETTHDIYDANKTEPEPEDGHKYETAKSDLEKVFTPKKNELIAEHEFTACTQKENQTFDEYITELLAKYCTFADPNDRLRSQLISHCQSSQLRKRVFREPEKYKSLDEVIELGRSMDAADKYSAQIERDLGFAKAIGKKPPRNKTSTRGRSRNRGKQNRDNPIPRDKSQNRQPRFNPIIDKNTCFRCGREWPHKKSCPAMGSTCNRCGKENHFEKMCFSKQRQKGIPSRQKRANNVRRINYEDDFTEHSSDGESDEYLYCIKTQQKEKISNTPKIQVKFNNVRSQVLVDTGASINIIDQATYERIGSPKVKRDKGSRLLPYGGGEPLKTLGTLKIQVETKTKYGIYKFHLVKGNYGSLIGFQSASDLGLVKIINKVSNPVRKHPNLFTGVGKLKNKTVKLHIDKSVKPVAIRHRRTPFHLRDKVEAEIKRLVWADIIEKVEDTPTPWISPIVTPPKKGGKEIRLCVDMREPNKAIIRERHIMPTLDELINDLNGAKIFSKLDLTSGYHQLELDKESRYITTFSTHVGIYQYKRLNFGISSASEVFQEAIRSVIQHVKGVKNISDDIIIYGRTQEEHDKALGETFEAISKAGLTLNKEKCEFNKQKISFFGVVFGPDGISPDPEKVKAIKEAAPPSNVKELRSFLGMTSYSSRFIPDYATRCEPLRKLTHKNTDWEWTDIHQETFDKLKEVLSDKTTVAYFDPTKQTEVIVDASPVEQS